MSLVVLAAGAALRPLPLEAADVSAPPGFQIVIQDPEGFRGRGFLPVYELSHALERQEGVVEVESIATFVPEATAEQAQNFFLSPLGAEPSEGLVAGTGVTRLVLRIGVAPGSHAARALVERARALSDRTLPDVASALVGGRAATLVDVRGALFAAYWGLALALAPAWLALRLSGRDARAALVAVGLGAARVCGLPRFQRAAAKYLPAFEACSRHRADCGGGDRGGRRNINGPKTNLIRVLASKNR